MGKRRVFEKQGVDSKSAIEEVKRKLIEKKKEDDRKELVKMEDPMEKPINGNIEMIQSQIQPGNDKFEKEINVLIEEKNNLLEEVEKAMVRLSEESQKNSEKTTPKEAEDNAVIIPEISPHQEEYEALVMGNNVDERVCWTIGVLQKLEKKEEEAKPVNVSDIKERLELEGLNQEQEKLELLVEKRSKTKVSRLENRLDVVEKNNEDLVRKVDYLASCNKEISEQVSNLMEVNRDLSQMVKSVEASNNSLNSLVLELRMNNKELVVKMEKDRENTEKMMDGLEKIMSEKMERMMNVRMDTMMCGKVERVMAVEIEKMVSEKVER